MKPAPFDFHDPESLDEAVALLAEHGDEAKVLAGGQTLIPMMNFRLARPSALVDVNRIRGLAGIEVAPAGNLRIGATTRQLAVQRSEAVAQSQPLITEALGFVAHAQIRARGTIGGSAAHADPLAELPAVLCALDATFVATSTRGDRSIEVGAFFRSHFETALDDDEVLVSIIVPALPPQTACGFHEFARRHGDYAVGGAAAVVTVDSNGACRRARIALLGAGATPIRPLSAEALLVGRVIDVTAAEEAATAAVDDLELVSADEGRGAYRRSVIRAMCRRAIETAARRANGRAA